MNRVSVALDLEGVTKALLLRGLTSAYHGHCWLCARYKGNPMRSPDSAFEFLDLSGADNYEQYGQQISAVVSENGRKCFKYLLYDNTRSCAFGIRSGGELVAFQGFVYKPVMLGSEVIPAFRSEFTIALPALRGTGVFPVFYKQTMQALADKYKRVYIWGQTKHKGFKKYGYEMRSGYSFYQVFSTAVGGTIRTPRIYNHRILNKLLVAYSALNPVRLLVAAQNVAVVDRISFADFAKYERGSLKGKLRLYLDDEQFNWRYLENPFEDYEYLIYKKSLVIVRRQDGVAHIVDIQASSAQEYLRLAAYIVRRYETVVFFGNILAQYRLPFFWIHSLLGFTPFLFGGSYVEYNKYAPEVRLNDNPLFLSWGFGVGES